MNPCVNAPLPVLAPGGPVSEESLPLELLKDRSEAGRRLADRLETYRDERPVVLALPRGGVPIAFEISRRLECPLDVLIARKIGAPGNPEYGLGAIAEDGSRWLDQRRMREAGYSLREIAPTITAEEKEAHRRAEAYRHGRPPMEVRDRFVILVDDGVATGGTLRVAIRSVRAQHPRRLVVALGVAPADTLRELAREADEVIAVLVPRVFFAVGEWYVHFDQVSDREVERLLELARVPLSPPA